MEPAKVRILWIRILCLKSVRFEFGFGFVPQSWQSNIVKAHKAQLYCFKFIVWIRLWHTGETTTMCTVPELSDRIIYIRLTSPQTLVL